MADHDSSQERPPVPEKFRPNLLVIFSIVVLIGVASFLWYMVQRTRGIKTPVSDNVLLFSLVVIIIILSLILLLMLFRNLIKYYFEGRKTPPRARIKTKLIIAFIGFSVIPSILLFAIASILITTSIDSWFNVRIEKSLQESMDVAKVYYENSKLNALYYGRQIAEQITSNKLLNEAKLSKLRNLIHQKQKEYNLGAWARRPGGISQRLGPPR